MLKKKGSGFPAKLSKSISVVIEELQAGRLMREEAVDWIKDLIEDSHKGIYTIYGTPDGSIENRIVKGRKFLI
jgi:hypothetical protein